MGLKTDCSSWVRNGLITEADMYDRNWAYWSIYSQDILWSLYVGRECSLVPHKKERMFPVPYAGAYRGGAARVTTERSSWHADVAAGVGRRGSGRCGKKVSAALSLFVRNARRRTSLGGYQRSANEMHQMQPLP